MAKIVWDQSGQRRYENGVDRGVLYLSDGSGVPWNGITSVSEDLSDISTTPHYFDGVKYLDTRYPGDFSATLKAFTYPDEFLEFDGYTELNNGVLLGHQPVYNRFGLSYRTKVGNDLDGDRHGYKIHIVYNLVATPDARNYATLSEQQNPIEFSWKITGVPEPIEGHRPTVHIVLDTTRLNPYLVKDIENILYGTNPVEIIVEDIDGGEIGGSEMFAYDGGSPEYLASIVYDGGTPSLVDADVLDGGISFEQPTPGIPDKNSVDGGSASYAQPEAIDGGDPNSSVTEGGTVGGMPPKLPALSDLVALINKWTLIDITDNGDGTWTATGPDDFITMLDSSTFQIESNQAIFLSEDHYQISTTHSL